jgi:two-component system response regulator NreC
MRIALITSEPVFRLGFQVLIESSGDLHLVADAGDARAGFHAIDVHKPDVLVMDVSLRGMNGINATREVKRRAPGTRVLLVADWGRERDAIEALAAGAHGMALKTDPNEELLGAVRRVGHGQLYVAPAFRRFGALETTKLARSKLPTVGADVLRGLSPREREVLDLIVRGWRNPAIARELCVSIKTVDTHRTRIHRKLGCTSASELIRFAAENDLLRRGPGSRDARPGRTIVLMVDDNPEVRADIMRELIGEGCRQVRATDATAALAELNANQIASLLVIDGTSGHQPMVAEIYRHLLGDDPALAKTPVMATLENGTRKPPVRAAASLPHEEGDAKLVAVLERAAGAHQPAVEPSNAQAL